MLTKIIGIFLVSLQEHVVGNHIISYGEIRRIITKHAYSNILKILPPEKMKSFR